MMRTFKRHLVGVGLLAAIGISQGCLAAPVGLLTGTFTGIVDAPWQVARTFEDEFEEQPGWWAPNWIIVAPVGAVFGGLAGFGKGIVIDAQGWIRGFRGDDLGEHASTAFLSYDANSLWRPYSFPSRSEQDEGPLDRLPR